LGTGRAFDSIRSRVGITLSKRRTRRLAIVYLPKEKILVNADLYGPPPAGGNLAAVNANAVALFRNIKRLKLDVATHVPIHGNAGANADFERIVGPVAARAPQVGGGG
jgi:hypothetical protein